MPQVLITYEKANLDSALKFAKVYSKTFKSSRIVVENYDDASGISVWKDLVRNHDNKNLILFVNGVRKKAK